MLKWQQTNFKIFNHSLIEPKLVKPHRVEWVPLNYFNPSGSLGGSRWKEASEASWCTRFHPRTNWQTERRGRFSVRISMGNERHLHCCNGCVALKSKLDASRLKLAFLFYCSGLHATKQMRSKAKTTQKKRMGKSFLSSRYIFATENDSAGLKCLTLPSTKKALSECFCRQTG